MTHRVRTLIRYLDFSSLRKGKILPSESMFTGIGRGGKFPPFAAKIGYPNYGLWIEHCIEYIIESKEGDDNVIVDQSIEMVKKTIPLPINNQIKSQFYYPLGKLLRERFIRGKAKYQEEWTLGPIQGHPDLIYEDCIYDIKTTGMFNAMRSNTILQLLSYFCLGRELFPGKFNKVGLILPAQNLILEVNLKGWDHTLFWKELHLCIDRKKDREHRYTIDSLMMMKYILTREMVVGGHVHKTNMFQVMKEYPHLPIQFFVAGRSNSNTSVAQPFRKKLKEACSTHKSGVYIHSPYTLNLSNPNAQGVREGEEYDVSYVTRRTRYLLQLGTECGLKGIVIHCGKRGKLTWDQAICNMWMEVHYIVSKASKECPLLIETSAGETGELYADVKEFIQFYHDLAPYVKKRVKICVDTCHVFSCGYDPYEYMMELINHQVPIGLIHYNDSLFDKGCHKDRHAQIGDGYIGYSPLIKVLYKAMELGIDCVYE